MLSLIATAALVNVMPCDVLQDGRVSCDVVTLGHMAKLYEEATGKPVTFTGVRDCSTDSFSFVIAPKEFLRTVRYAFFDEYGVNVRKGVIECRERPYTLVLLRPAPDTKPLPLRSFPTKPDCERFRENAAIGSRRKLAEYSWQLDCTQIGGDQ